MHQPHASSTGPGPGPIGPVDMATPIEHMETRQKHIEEEQARIEKERTKAINRLAALRSEGRDSKNTSFTQREPQLTPAAVAGFVTAAVAVSGIAITQDQIDSLVVLVMAGVGVVPLFSNLVAYWRSRKNTTYLGR